MKAMPSDLLTRLVLISRQLRWKIIAGHMVVVLVGVLTLSLVGEWVMLRNMPADVTAHVAALLRTTNPQDYAQITENMLATFYHDAVARALLVAATGAILAGLLTSLFLAREILRPLSQVAQSSRRIAAGRYTERVAIPASTELAQLAINFNQMAEALEQAEQQRVALISTVMHELRTPLSGLAGYLEGLLDGLFAAEPQTFAQMQQEVRRLHRLVDDLQALSRVEAGQIALALQPFNLIPVLERVLAQLAPQAQELTLKTGPLPPTLTLCADPDRTAQILLNLVGNAINYTPAGGHIWLDVAQSGSSAIIRVRDNGLGIPAEALPYIFERFYRVDRSRARAGGGSGIGLTISRHLAWAMGGDLTAASPGPGQGSTFTLTLPLGATP